MASIAGTRKQRLGVAARRSTYRIHWDGYLYVLPAFLMFAVFLMYPVLYNTALSFNKWDGVAPAWQLLGLENYERLIKDRVVGLSLRNSGIFVLGHVVAMLLGLSLAVLLTNRYRGRSIVRTLIFLPNILASSIVAVTWSTIYEPNLGALNAGLRGAGLGGFAQQWLANPQLAIWAVTLVGIWASTGFPMVVYLAALQTIDPEVFDAARIDGANRRQLFWHITLPLLASTHRILFMLGVIAAVQAFDVAFILTGGGPFFATSTLGIHVYRTTFAQSDFGYGAALSEFILVLLMVLTLVQRLRFRTKEVREP